MHYVKYKKWWSTKSFQQAGRYWLQDDKYCPFSEDSHAYTEFWDEQEHYIRNGMTVEGQRIAGLHYLYLNYCPIKKKKVRKLSLPDFWAIDADYFLELEEVLGIKPGMTQEEISARAIVFSASKTRQCGASLKGGVPILYNMNFVPFSANYIGAYLEKDAIKTLNMYLNYHRHLYRYTEFGKRFIKKESNKYYKIGYHEEIDGEKIEAGFQSELSIISFKDNPEKGVGGSCDLFIIEEAGMHPQLLQSVTYITPACAEGDYTTGNILVYGAAGKEGQCDDLKKLHYSPRSYKAKAYTNKWDSSPLYDECGYFIPNYSCRGGHIDDDGNPNPETAIIARNKELETLKKNDIIKYYETLSQYPNDGKEMFGARGKKRYDTAIIEQQIANIIKNEAYGTPVELFDDINTGQVYYKISDKTPIRYYPLPPDADPNGCVEIFEFPISANPPKNLYIASIDSYNQDQSETTTSLGSIFIYKKVDTLGESGTNRVVVAEYTGRPSGPFGKQDFYKICERLLKLYNAVALPENEDQELVPWFYNRNTDYLLADQPDIIRSIIPNSSVKRSKGIHAAPALIVSAENKIARYLYEPIGDIYDKNEEGQYVSVGKKLGVTRIPSLSLLYELKDYTNEGNKNFDRCRTFGWLLLYEEETINLEVLNNEDEDLIDFLNTPEIIEENILSWEL